ncbi:MAG: tyrosine-type recombinase/integrase [Thalassospira sp.]|uniref:tyrosine-type recombinase/integrase n=1 Tax=Thalassospira sp. TaxID=1912094 RepID=UPI003A8486CE
MPDDRSQRIKVLNALNDLADKNYEIDRNLLLNLAKSNQLTAHSVSRLATLGQVVENEGQNWPGSIGWVIAKYKNSRGFKELAEGTKKFYIQYMNEVHALGPDLPISAFTTPMLQDFVDTFDGIKGADRKLKTILNLLFKTAIKWEVMDKNPAQFLETTQGSRRQIVWEPAEIEAWYHAAQFGDRAFATTTAFCLLQYTAQRPIDVLKMPVSHFNPATNMIRVRQQKTGAFLEIPLHRDAIDRIAEAVKLAKEDGCTTIVQHEGRPVPYTTFLNNFRRATAKDMAHLQPRDLRRTAAVRMSEAGATTTQISAVAGWSIEQTSKILEHYVPRTTEMARGAIAAWEKSV